MDFIRRTISFAQDATLYLYVRTCLFSDNFREVWAERPCHLFICKTANSW